MKSETELNSEFEYRDQPDHTRHLLGMLISAILSGVLCGYGIVYAVLNYEMLDNLKPEVQLVIVMIALLAFAVLRGIMWFRNL